MAAMHLLFLDEEDIALASKILRNVKDIGGIEAAVKRALKECAAKWPGPLIPVQIVEWVDVGTPELEMTRTAPVVPGNQHIPLGRHHTAVYEFPLDKLSGVKRTVLMGKGTLDRLEPDSENLSTLLEGIKIGKIEH
jgi:hypothetical protein